MTTESPSTTEQILRVDPDVFRPDPHPGFARYRPLAGLINVNCGMPIVTRYADVARLMTDERTRQLETESLEASGIRSGSLYAFYANSMLVSNAPVHAQRRAPVARAFAYKLIAAWRPRIRALATELIERHAHAGEIDFVQSIAEPLPSRIIAEILGAPQADAPRFAAMVYRMSKGLANFREDEFADIETNTAALTTYVEDLLSSRRAAPRDDFLTDYVRRVDETGQLSEAETLIQIVTLIIAGSDTTRLGLTALVSLLLQHRDQWDAVCNDPDLAAAAVREALRHEPPVGSIGRVVTEPLTVDGVALEPGAVLALSMLSAQRDETVFKDAQAFDITRDDHPRLSLSFGLGPHRCLGEALARAEMEEVLIALTWTAPDLHLIGSPPVFKGHMGIRGIAPMQVGWQKA